MLFTGGWLPSWAWPVKPRGIDHVGVRGAGIEPGRGRVNDVVKRGVRGVHIGKLRI